MKAATTTFVFIVLAMLLCACQTLSPKQEQAPAPIGAKELLTKLHKRGGQIHSVEADSKFEFFHEGRHERAELIWVVRKPGDATFELTGPTGMLGIWTNTRDEFRYFDIREKRVLFGPVTSKAMRDVLRWTILPTELVPLLCATPIILPGGATRPVYDPETKHYRFSILATDQGLKQIFWFDREGELYRIRVVQEDKSVRYQVTYLNWQVRGEEQLAFPGYIKVEHPQSETVLTLTLRSKPTLNGTIDPQTFQLPFPDGIPRMYIPGE